MAGPTPQQQLSLLQQLSAQGKLSGVQPESLYIIDQAESGYEVSGAGVNNFGPGYGGYFGTSVPDTPGGASTLLSQTPQAFEVQAQTAAPIFATGLQKGGGSPQLAAQYFVTGSTAKGKGWSYDATLEAQHYGGQILAHNPSSPGGGNYPTSAVTTSKKTASAGSWLLGLQGAMDPNLGLNANPLDLFGVAASTGSTLIAVLSRGGFVVAGLIMVLVGLAIMGVEALGPIGKTVAKVV